MLSFFCVASASAQDMWKYFTPDDFAARRAKVIEKIGDGIAVLQGAELTEAYINSVRTIISITSQVPKFPMRYLCWMGRQKWVSCMFPMLIPNDIKAEAMIKPERMLQTYTVQSRGIKNVTYTGLAVRHYPWPPILGSDQSWRKTMEMSRDRCLGIRAARLNDPLDGRIRRKRISSTKFKRIFRSFPSSPYTDSWWNALGKR